MNMRTLTGEKTGLQWINLFDDVATAVRNDPAVAAATYLDQPAAQAEFASIMSNQPNVAVPDELPTSFHVALNAGQDRDTARARYLTLSGVEEIILVAPH